MTGKTAILVYDSIHAHIRERLAAEFDLVHVKRGEKPALAAADAARIRGAAIFSAFGAEWIDALPNLEIIGNFGVGYDGVALDAAIRRGIVVTNTPDVLNDEVADTAVALLINTVRQLPRAEQWLRAGRWSEGPFPLSPLSLKDRTVGLYGLGRIGLEIARRLEPFKLKIGYHTRRQREDVAYRYYPSLMAMAEAVDTLICIVPGTAETHKAIDAAIFKALGPRGVFINVGRGKTADEAALIGALRDGTIAAAGLDVFHDEPNVPEALLALENAVLLPHVASASVPTRDAMGDLVVDNIRHWFQSGRVLTPVPETPAPLV